jgi:hypothetical protein
MTLPPPPPPRALVQNAITGKWRKGKPPLINSKNVRTPTNKFEAKWDEGMPKPKAKPKPADPKATAGADPKAAGGVDPKAAAGAATKAGEKAAADDEDDDGAKEEPKLWVGNFRCICGGS